MKSFVATFVALSMLISGSAWNFAPFAGTEHRGGPSLPVNMRSVPADSGAVCRLPHEQTNLANPPMRAIAIGTSNSAGATSASNADQFAIVSGALAFPLQSLQANHIRLQI